MAFREAGLDGDRLRDVGRVVGQSLATVAAAVRELIGDCGLEAGSASTTSASATRTAGHLLADTAPPPARPAPVSRGRTATPGRSRGSPNPWRQQR